MEGDSGDLKNRMKMPGQPPMSTPTRGFSLDSLAHRWQRLARDIGAVRWEPLGKTGVTFYNRLGTARYFTDYPEEEERRDADEVD